MNRLVLSLILLLGLPLAVNAQEPPMTITGNYPCDDFEKMRNDLRTKYNEIPIASGEGLSRLLNMETGGLEFAPHGMYLFVNPELYEYSLIFTLNVRDGKQVGCIVSSGKNFGPVIQDTGI